MAEQHTIFVLSVKCLSRFRPRRREPATWRFSSRVLASFLALIVAAAASAQTLTVGKADPVRFLDAIKSLTVPTMEGRGDDTKGIALAAQLLEQRYKGLGLEPAGTNGYFQPFSLITGAKIAGRNHFREQVGGITKDLKLNDDFVPFSFSSSGK